MWCGLVGGVDRLWKSRRRRSTAFGGSLAAFCVLGSDADWIGWRRKKRELSEELLDCGGSCVVRLLERVIWKVCGGVYGIQSED